MSRRLVSSLSKRKNSQSRIHQLVNKNIGFSIGGHTDSTPTDATIIITEANLGTVSTSNLIDPEVLQSELSSSSSSFYFLIYSRFRCCQHLEELIMKIRSEDVHENHDR